jgi:hypothetical protein
MIDVPVCLKSGYLILTDPVSGSAMYTPGYKLDAATNSAIVKVAKQYGSCSTCASGMDTSKLQEGLRVTFDATVKATNATSIPTISATSAIQLASAGQQSSSTGGGGGGGGSNATVTGSGGALGAFQSTLSVVLAFGLWSVGSMI